MDLKELQERCAEIQTAVVKVGCTAIFVTLAMGFCVWEFWEAIRFIVRLFS